MITKIIFSDSTVTMLDCGNAALAKELKKANDDDEVSELMGKYRGSYTICDESDIKREDTLIDLRKKKRTREKQKHEAYGQKYR